MVAHRPGATPATHRHDDDEHSGRGEGWRDGQAHQVGLHRHGRAAGLPDGSLIFTETQPIASPASTPAPDVDVSREHQWLQRSAWDAAAASSPCRPRPARPVSASSTRREGGHHHRSFEGKPYGRPNDLVVSRRGHIYFTEPGPNTPAGPATTTPPLPPAVYHVTPEGRVSVVARDIARPNGIVLSPDEKTLYVNNTNGTHMLAFDVAADGSTGNRREFAKYAKVATSATGVPNSGADGLAVDAAGRVRPRPPASRSSARRARSSASSPSRSLRRTSLSRAPTRRRSTSSGAERRGEWPWTPRGTWTAASSRRGSRGDVGRAIGRRHRRMCRAHDVVRRLHPVERVSRCDNRRHDPATGPLRPAPGPRPASQPVGRRSGGPGSVGLPGGPGLGTPRLRRRPGHGLARRHAAEPGSHGRAHRGAAAAPRGRVRPSRRAHRSLGLPLPDPTGLPPALPAPHG